MSNDNRIEVQATISEDDKNSLMQGMGRHLIQAATPDEKLAKHKEQDVEKYYKALRKRYNELNQERERKDKEMAHFYHYSNVEYPNLPDVSDFQKEIAEIDKEILENIKEQQKYRDEYNAIQNKKRKERLTHNKESGDGGQHHCNQYKHDEGCPNA